MTERGRQAVLKLDFIVVGGGLTGLATAQSLASSGHRVRIFEKSSTGTSSSSAGVRVSPNGSRVLLQWGLSEQIQKCASEVPSLDFVDMASGARLGYLAMAVEIIEQLGAPPLNFLHQDLHDILHDLAISSGVQITYDATVTSVSPSRASAPSSPLSTPLSPEIGRPSVTLATGETFHADVIIGADGNHSIVRPVVEDVPPVSPPTSLVVYTGTIPMEVMLANDLTRDIVAMRSPYWTGDKALVVSFPINDQAWAVSLFVDEDGTEDAPDGWDVSVSPRSVIRHPAEPRLNAMLDRLPTGSRIKSSSTPHAESWIDDSERIILTGEAAHPFTPCGLPVVSSALEDACVLGTLFSHIRHPSQISSLLYAYEEICQPRAHAGHNLELANLTMLRLPPGAGRNARNEIWASVKSLKQDEEAHVHSRSDAEPEGQELREQWQGLFDIWGFDAKDAAEDWWLKWGVLEERALGSAWAGEHDAFVEGMKRMSLHCVETVVE